MATRLAAVETRRSGVAELTGLSPERTLLLKQRLLAEKESILADFDQSSPLRQVTGRRKPGVWISSGVAALLLLSVGLFLLRRPAAAPETRIVYSKGEVKTAEQSLRAGDKTATGSIISTGTASATVLRHSEHITTTLAPNTRVVIRQAANNNGTPHLELESQGGLIFCNVAKGRATLTIQTPSAEIRVIGTSFSVDTGPAGTTVSVLEGIVQVHSDEKKPVGRKIHAGERILIAQKNREITSRQLTGSESGALKDFLQLSTTDPAKDDLTDTMTRVLKEENVLRAQNTSPKITLAEIRKKYGKISRVNLTNGASYVGFLTMRGNQMRIVTVNGTVSVSKALLRDVRDAN